jgi:hypothetical protein
MTVEHGWGLIEGASGCIGVLEVADIVYTPCPTSLLAQTAVRICRARVRQLQFM